MSTVANYLLEKLRSRGVSHIFGVPGDYVLPFVNALEGCEGIEHMPLADERDAAWAANLAGRGYGKLSACYATSMVGGLNMLNPVLDGTKHLGASAMVVIGGEVALADREKDYVLHHELGAPPAPIQEEVFQKLLGGKEYAKSITCLSSAENDIRRLIARACEEHRPVYIGLPKDVCNMIAGGYIETRISEKDESDAPYALWLAEEIRDRVTAAKRPVILVGQDAERFGLIPLVKRFANTFGISVAATFKGFGAYPSDDDNFIGVYSAQASFPPETQGVLESSDCLIRIGTVKCDMTNGLREPRLPEAAIIIDPATFRVFVSDGWVRFRSIRYIQRVLEHVSVVSGERQRPLLRSFLSWMDEETDRYLSAPVKPRPVRFSGIVPILHDRLRMSPDTPVVADIGNAMTMPIVTSGGYYTSAYGAMGVTVGALGIEIATGKRPLVIVGDGAFGMWSLGALLSLRRHRSKMIIIVLNNEGWGMLRPITGNAAYLDLISGNFEKLTEFAGAGLGFPAKSEAEFKNALTRAFEADTFSIINVLLIKEDMTDGLYRLMVQK